MRILTVVFQTNKYLVVAGFLFLVACTTTEISKTDSSQTPATNTLSFEEQQIVLSALTNEQKYNIGSYASYSEVCSQFRGSGAEPKVVDTIKKVFSGDGEFRRGYSRFDNYAGYDSMSGLTECGEVKESLATIFKILVP